MDCNCRCCLLQIPRWAIDHEFTKIDNSNQFTKDGEINLINGKDYNEYKKNYFKHLNNFENDDKILSLEECKQMIENQNIKFWQDDLSKIDKKLLSDNTKRLKNLIDKYPKMKKFIDEKNVNFNALTMGKNEIALCSTNLDISKISISLSKKYYSNYDNFIKMEEEGFKKFWSMPCSENLKSVYSLTHEFGHFIENKIIDDYNKQHLAEFLNMKTRALNAKSNSQSRAILRKWQKSIADNVAQEIYEIAEKSNANIKINDLLSEYGKTNSFEFFAECFANLECGKPNELAKALGEYLKKRGI